MKKFTWLLLPLPPPTLLCYITFNFPPHSPICTLFPLGAFSGKQWILGVFYHSLVRVSTPLCCPDPPPQSTKWPSVLFRENNISCYCGGVPEQREGNRQCDWHRVTNTLNPDNRKLMQRVQLKAQHTACGTLKLTRLSRWHMLILWPWPLFHLWFFACGCPQKLLAHTTTSR